MRRIVTVVILLALAVFSTGVAAPPVNPTPGTLRAVMELRQQFYYVGEPMAVRVTISNDGPTEVANPVKSPLFGSMLISTPNAVYGGVVADDATTRRSLLEAAARLAQELNVDFLELRDTPEAGLISDEAVYQNYHLHLKKDYLDLLR